MALKFKAKTKEEIPAELQSLYVEREGSLAGFAEQRWDGWEVWESWEI
jgi:hypothetical protein